VLKRLLASLTLAALLATAFAVPASAITFFTMRFTVTDASTSFPLADVCVEIHAVPGCLGTDRKTDSNGVMTSPSLPAGSDWDVWFEKAGYSQGHVRIPGTNTANVDMPIALTPAASTACNTGGTPTTTTYLPNITRRLGGASGWKTPFYVQNAGSVPTTIEASFFNFNTGAFTACHKTTNLGAGASYVDDPNVATDLVDNTQYSVVVKSFGAPAVAAVNQTQTATGKLQALSYSGFQGGATTVYVPNVTRRFFGYDVPLIIQNLGTVSTTVTANFKSFDNLQNVNLTLNIPAGRSGVIDPDWTAGLTDQTQYAVKLTSAQPIGVIANAHNELIGPLAFSHNGLAVGATTLYGPYATKAGPAGAGNATFFSNVVVQNVGTGTTTATLTFTPVGGGTDQTFTLAGIPQGGAKAFDVRFASGIALPNTAQCGGTASATCLGNGNYSLTISASTSIAAVVLPNSSTISAGYLAAPAPTGTVVLPVVSRKANAFTSPIHLQSIGASSATLTYYAMGSGTLAATQTLTLTSGTSQKIDPTTVTGLADGQSYSVVITAASGNITAVVDELSTQTGDNEMVYEGFAQ
jgi:hypothetical protein